MCQPVTEVNDDIREFSKVFTGLSWGDEGNFFGRRLPWFTDPMRMFEEAHEPGEKRLLNGTVLPASNSGMEDIEGAIDNLFYHPNTGPFIGKQLIQRLVSSNPSPAYVARVTAAFNDNGQGVRGDMQAVIKAILLDPEALADPDPNGTRGKLREPVVRITSVLRQFEVNSSDNFYANAGFVVEELVKQHPLSSPSVFNFFLPGYTPPGEIAAAGLVAPEFQITTSSTVVGVTNLVDYGISADYVNDIREGPFQPSMLNLEPYITMASDLDMLLDRLDLILTYGTLSDETRRVISNLASQLDDPEIRLRVALYMLLVSPDYAVSL